MKVALVHDPLYKLGGAERVLDIFHELYPQAPLYTPIYDAEGTQNRYKDWDIRTSYLQNLPGRIPLINFYRALMPAAVEQWDLMDYDLVISSVTSVAKGVITRQDARHIAYFHNVTRFAWMDLESHLKGAGFGLTAWPARIALHNFRQWDFLAADRPDFIVANSRNVADRIKKYYRRETAAIIYPPVELDRFRPVKNPDQYFLIVSRLEPHKSVDLAVAAFNKLGFPLKIVGNGPELPKLQALAKNNIEFLGRLDDRAVADLMARCRAFIYPQEEDFGISAVEAMAAGRPIIALEKGGARETIIPGRTGEFFAHQTATDLEQAVASFVPERYTASTIRRHAEKFSQDAFKKNWQEFMERTVKIHGTA